MNTTAAARYTATALNTTGAPVADPFNRATTLTGDFPTADTAAAVAPYFFGLNPTAATIRVTDPTGALVTTIDRPAA